MSDTSPLPGELRKKAEENDVLIATNVRMIEEELEELGLFNLIGKPGVLELWYAFGKRLSFIDELDLSGNAKRYVWRAIYDHSIKLYNPHEPIPQRIKDRPEYNDIRYSYIIGKLDWNFVRTAGGWRSWVDFLDSEVMREDMRIVEWIKRLQEIGPRTGGYLIDLRKAISERFRNVVTSDYDADRLFQILDETHQIALKEYTKQAL
ncbi:MAG: hypothetical protein ACW98Y_07275 [Candidatus Thorarchaeota archaeon]